MISSNSALAFCYFFSKRCPFSSGFLFANFFFAGAAQKKKLYDHKKNRQSVTACRVNFPF